MPILFNRNSFAKKRKVLLEKWIKEKAQSFSIGKLGLAVMFFQQKSISEEKSNVMGKVISLFGGRLWAIFHQYLQWIAKLSHQEYELQKPNEKTLINSQVKLLHS